MFQNAIKWSGSKRAQAATIASHFPKKIDTFYEPFLGSGATLRYALHARRVVASDICAPLIDVWRNMRDDPENLAECYRIHWEALQKDKDYYYIARDAFNSGDGDAGTFLFLTRTAANGLIRFNRKGGFNSPLHPGRDGMRPETLRSIILDWARAVKDVEFVSCDFRDVSPGPDDFAFLDPPYFGSTSQYYGNFDHEALFVWLAGIPRFAMTFDGSRDGVRGYRLDRALYDRSVTLPGQQSSFDRYRAKKTEVREMLYLKGV